MAVGDAGKGRRLLRIKKIRKGGATLHVPSRGAKAAAMNPDRYFVGRVSFPEPCSRASPDKVPPLPPVFIRIARADHSGFLPFASPLSTGNLFHAMKLGIGPSFFFRRGYLFHYHNILRILLC